MVENISIDAAGPVRTAPAEAAPVPRAAWRAVAVPTEHGGWALSVEPAIVGLLIAPSLAGLLLGIAAVVGFLFRTPAKVVLVDLFRSRRLPRTRLAALIAGGELAVLVALGIGIIVLAEGAWWVPLLVAAPLVGLELWFDMRSRSRRLLPELAGSVAMGAVASSIVLAGGGEVSVALAAWLVIAVRAVASIPYARTQVQRAKGHVVSFGPVGAALGVSLAVSVLAGLVGWWPWSVTVAAAVLVGVHATLLRTRPVRAVIVGVTQLVLGIALMVIAGLAL